jgi:hypothetical protein
MTRIRFGRLAVAGLAVALTFAAAMPVRAHSAKSQNPEAHARAESAQSQKIGDDRTESQTSRNLTTTPTPPVVSRRPVSTTGLGRHGIQEHPAQRLANPKFVPQASNRGRSEPAEKGSTSRRH